MTAGRESASPGSPEPVSGLTDPRSVSLERAPIRTRESASTLSGWRLAVASREGEGAIFLVDGPGGVPVYRGEGVFLGWTQERLAAAYEALRPRPPEEGFELPQLG